jgi:branched-chain amino acid transport system permease protein
LLFIEQILNGLQLGIILFLMAAGLTLTFGIMNLVNLAHGSLFMVGAYLGVTFQMMTGSFIAGLVMGTVGTFLIGLVLEFILIRHLYKRDHLDQVLCTVGIIFFFNEATRMVWGPEPLHAPVPPALTGTIDILPGVPYPTYRLAIIIAGLIVAALLYVLISKTRTGMLIRAGASNRIMTTVLGININLVYALIFALGSALAGFAGFVAGPILTVYPGMGDNILIVTLVVLIIGGMGSIKGAFVAALLVGIIDTMGRAYLKQLFGVFMPPVAANTVAPAVASMLIYVLMAVVLFLKPEGLFPPPGTRRAASVAATTRSFEVSVFAGLFQRWRVPVIAFLCAALAFIPAAAWLFDEPFWLDLVTRMMIFAIATLSLDLVLGHAGLVSFGHALYLGIGAYVVGIMSHHGMHNGFVQWPLAMLLSALVALPVGMISLRTSGTFFIMITLAFAQMMYFASSSLYSYGGDDGLTLAQRSKFGGLLDLYDAYQFYYIVLLVLAGAALFSARIMHSRFGSVLRGVRINETRMEAVGYPVMRYKLVAYVISAAGCGLAGALLANATEFAGPQFMEWSRSGELMIMAIFGGLATTFGPIIGAIAYLGLEKYLSAWTIHWKLLLGPILIAVVFLGRGGLYSLLAPTPEVLHSSRSLPRWRRPYFGLYSSRSVSVG